MDHKPYFINPNDVANAKLHKLIEQWVRDKFQFGESVIISISEIKCADAGCPDIDTYIYIKNDLAVKKYRVAKPLVYVRKWDIDAMREVV